MLQRSPKQLSRRHVLKFNYNLNSLKNHQEDSIACAPTSDWVYFHASCFTDYSQDCGFKMI